MSPVRFKRCVVSGPVALRPDTSRELRHAADIVDPHDETVLIQFTGCTDDVGNDGDDQWPPEHDPGQ
jgi:hypothetical protein